MVLLSLLSLCVTVVSNLHNLLRLFFTNFTSLIMIIFIFQNLRYGATMWRSKHKNYFVKDIFLYFCVYMMHNVYVFILLMLNFPAMKRELHFNYPLILGVIGALIAVTLLALGLYAQKRCIGDNYTRERGNRYHRVYESFCSLYIYIYIYSHSFFSMYHDT